MAGCTLKPLEFLHILDESERRIFFFALDYVTDHLQYRGSFPPAEIFGSLTNKKHITSYVWAYIQQQDRTTLRQKVAALSTWKPLFLAVPPGQATGHRISSTVPARKTEAPLNGALLLDGQAKAWDERLKEKSDSYYGETNGPLILNYHEARQIRAEYASLECKAVAPNRGADFPNTVEEQRHLVAKLYDAIMNMENILEKKRPFALKKTINTEAKEAVASEKDALAEGSSTTITPARKRPASEMASDADDESSGQDNQSSDEDDEHDDSRSGPPSMETSPTAKVVEKPKETISVVKVKSLSRIEVEMLCWEILYTIRDVDRGQLPFMSWSGRDWGWDAQFATFQDRFEAVATTLRRSKAAVCSLLESDYMARLAAHPRREYRRKENNRSQNAERNAQVFVGRHAIGTGQVQVGLMGDLQDRDGNVVAAAGTVHSGLIEQTRKLGEMSRREAAAKRAKLTAGETTATSGNPAAVAGETNGTPAPRKPRIRKRKPTAKAPAANTDNEVVVTARGPSTESMSENQSKSAEMAEVETKWQDTSGELANAFQASAANLNRTFSVSSSALTMASASPGLAEMTSAPETPFAWSGANNASATAIVAPTNSFNSPSRTWTSDYETLFAVEGLAKDSNSSSSLDLLNSGVPFSLPFHPAPTRVALESPELSSPADKAQKRVSPPEIVTEAPMDDVFGTTTTAAEEDGGCIANGESMSGDLAPIIYPGMVTQHSLDAAMLIKWDMDDPMNFMQEFGSYSYDPNAPSSCLDASMNLKTGYPFDTDLWTMQSELGFDDLEDDVDESGGSSATNAYEDGHN